jgi:hypothetical protein
MARIVFFLLALLPWGCLHGQTPSADALQWKKTTVKIETQGRLDKMSATFAFKNISRQPVTITGITTSCGCTVAETSQHAVAPGQSGTITVQHQPVMAPGARYYHVTVTTQEPGTRSYALKLEVLHEPRVGMDKRLLVWEQGEPRSAKVIKLTVKAGDTLQIKGAKAEKDLFNFDLKDGPAPGQKLLTVTPKMFAGVTGGKTRILLVTEPPLASPSEAPIFAILR